MSFGLGGFGGGGNGGFGCSSVAATGLLATQVRFGPVNERVCTKQVDVEEQDHACQYDVPACSRSDGLAFLGPDRVEMTRADACTKIRAKCLTCTAQLILELTYGSFGARNKRIILVVYDLKHVKSAKHVGNCTVKIEVVGPSKCYRSPEGGSGDYKAKELGTPKSSFEVIADVTGHCRKMTVQFELKPKKKPKTQKVEDFVAAMLHTEAKKEQQVQHARGRAMEKRIEKEMEEESLYRAFVDFGMEESDDDHVCLSFPTGRKQPMKRTIKKSLASGADSGVGASGSPSSANIKTLTGTGLAPRAKRPRIPRFVDPVEAYHREWRRKGCPDTMRSDAFGGVLHGMPA